MIVQVKGVNFLNKGAELMLRSIAHELTQWDESNIIAVDLRTGSFSQRKQAEIHHLSWLESIKYSSVAPILDAGVALIPNLLRKPFKVVSTKEVDAVLDASGFSYSDQWPTKHAQRMSELSKIWKASGKAVVLMPQALGPFTKDDIRTAFTNVVETVDLVIARDRVSFAHLESLGVPLDNVVHYPDFTNLIPAIVPDYVGNLETYCCLIPNARMIDKTDDKTGQHYLDFLMLSINLCLEADLKPVVLIHENYDAALGQELCDRARIEHNVEVKMIKEADPLRLKGIIKHAHMIVGSRFHGLIAGLSQAVPCIGTGWSHKYQELFEDYDCSSYLMETTSDEASLRKVFTNILDVENYAFLKKKLYAESLSQKELSREMWQLVRSKISHAQKN